MKEHNEITVHVNTSEFDQAQAKIDHLIESVEKLDNLISKQNKKLAKIDKLDDEKVIQKLEELISKAIDEGANF